MKHTADVSKHSDTSASMNMYVVYSPALLLHQEVKKTVTGFGCSYQGCVLDQEFVVAFQNTQYDIELHPSNL